MLGWLDPASLLFSPKPIMIALMFWCLRSIDLMFRGIRSAGCDNARALQKDDRELVAGIPVVGDNRINFGFGPIFSHPIFSS